MDDEEDYSGWGIDDLNEDEDEAWQNIEAQDTGTESMKRLIEFIKEDDAKIEMSGRGITDTENFTATMQGLTEYRDKIAVYKHIKFTSEYPAWPEIVIGLN